MLDKKKPYGTIYPGGLLVQDDVVYYPDGRKYEEEEVLYVCEQCGKEFDTERGLNLHARRSHVDE